MPDKHIEMEKFCQKVQEYLNEVDKLVVNFGEQKNCIK